ncbi:heterokaryon incompatibility protein [Lasiodiplodia theobromae]|nr:heterokaryon incompatibility protein [Lasiodiplodia theobromae]
MADSAGSAPDDSLAKNLVLLQKEGSEPRPQPEHWARQLVKDYTKGLPYEYREARVEFPEDHPDCPVCGIPRGLPLSIYVLTSWTNVERHPTLPDVGDNIENCERCEFICFWLVRRKGLREACENESGKITVRMRGKEAGWKELSFALPQNADNDFVSDGAETVLARSRNGKFGFEFGRQDEEFTVELWSANRVIPVTASSEDRRVSAISAAPFGRKGRFVREVAPRSDDQSCFDLARTWLEACRARHHKLCRQTGTSLPPRLLTLTISADDAEDDDAGIYGEQRNHRMWRYKCFSSGNEDYGNPLLLTEKWPHPTLSDFTQGEINTLMLTVDTSPLTTRAWTLQERLMSTRVLHFTRFEIIWECNTGTQCECARDSGFHSRMLESIEFDQLLNDDKIDRQQWLHHLWYQYVGAYTKRALTNINDRLPALSGLAKRFQGHLETVTGEKPTFLAGLWGGDLATGLTWELNSRAKETSSKTDVYLAPSWSWASRMGSISYFSVKAAHPHSGRPYPYQGVETTSHIEVLDAGTSLATADPLGRVKDGRIQVSGAAVDFYFDGPQPEDVDIIQRYVKVARCAMEFNLMGVTGYDGDYNNYTIYETASQCFSQEEDSPALEQSKKRTIVVRDENHRCIAFQPDDVQDVRNHPGEYSSLVCLRVSEQVWGTPFRFDVGSKLKITYFLFLRPSSRVPGAYERVGLIRTTSIFEKEEYAQLEEIFKTAEVRKLTLV